MYVNRYNNTNINFILFLLSTTTNATFRITTKAKFSICLFLEFICCNCDLNKLKKSNGGYGIAVGKKCRRNISTVNYCHCVSYLFSK